MDLLTNKQSDLLKRANDNTLLYSSLNNEEKIISSFLKDNGYIIIIYKALIDGSNEIRISEKGKKYLENAERELANREKFDDQLKSLEKMADSAIEQVELAKRQAIESKKEARQSKIIAWISILISIISLTKEIILDFIFLLLE